MIRKLARSIRKYKKESILAPLFMAGEVITEVLIPYFTANLIDFGIELGDMEYIMRQGIFLLLFALLPLLTGSLSGWFAAHAAAGFSANLRRDVFASVQRFSFSNVDKFSTASLVTRMTTDVMNVQMAYQAIIRQAVRGIIMIGMAMAMVFRINAQMALIYVAVIPILGAGLVFIILNVHPLFVRAFKVYDKMNSLVQENLHGIRVVKSFVREDMEIGKFDGISNELYQNFSRASKRVAFNMPLLQICIYACMILVSWIGAKLVVQNTMTTGELMSMFTYTMQILMSLNLMSMVFVMIIISRASAERIVEVLNEEPTLRQPDNPICDVPDGSIAFRGVDFSYVNDPGKCCLSGIDIEIRSGETIGILGGTGSSKSTLVQLIPRLYDTTIGTVEVGGHDVRTYDIASLRGAVAMVLQKNTLFSGTVAENLRWGNEDASLDELKRVCALACADEFIEALPQGYDTFIEQGGTNVSGGQKQRLCIARALLKKPKILILDDSTSAVDTKTDAMIRKAFREEIPNTTKLIIAQRIASVQDADRILVLDGGRVAALGTHEELLVTSDIYKETYTAQMQAGGDFDE